MLTTFLFKIRKWNHFRGKLLISVARETKYSLKYVFDKWLSAVDKTIKFQKQIKLLINRNAERVKKMAINNWKIFNVRNR